MSTKFKCRLTVSVASANPTLATAKCFDATYRDSRASPIEEFLRRLESINLLVPPPAKFNSLQAQLVLLGVIAAVESYFRAIFRRLIFLDETSAQSVHEKDVPYAAAMYLSKQLLPEAILEKTTFVSKKTIEDAIRELLGVKGNLPPDLTLAIQDYVRVCQLRHCAVHRFGKLGARNAIALGLSDHSSLLEKPLRLDYAALQDVIAIATGMVKVLNNFLFNEILSRVPGGQWTGAYTSDRRVFLKYYNIFCDRVSANRTAKPEQLYLQFMRQYSTWAALEARK